MAKKDYNYFEAFVEISDYALKAANYLHETLVNFNSDTIHDRMHEIHEIEHTADTLKHDLTDHLIKEFLPPIDREDIMFISNVLDDVIDKIEDIVMRLYMYDVKEIPPYAIELSETIVACTKSLVEAIKEFENFRKSKTLNSLIMEINSLEEKGDKQYAEATHELFVSSKDYLHTLAWMTLYERLEKCCDSCEDVASSISRAVMNNL